MERTKRSAYAFKFGLLAGSFTVSTPTPPSVPRNDAENSGSRSWMRKRVSRRNPSIASVAAMAPQCAFRNVLHGIRLRRSGAGSSPCSARMRFTVFLPTSCPRLRIAPQILVWPQLEFSRAILRTSSRIVCATRGRPGPRRWVPSYFFAISFLYQRNKVLGVTRSEISFRPSLPNAFAFAARRRRWTLIIGETYATFTELLPENSILFLEVFDRILLGPADPPGKSQREELP